jgi:hypothetical protein
MIDPRVMDALGIAPDATDAQVAAQLRRLAGLAPDETTDAALWVRFAEGIDAARRGAGGARVDLAQLANRVVEYAISPPGFPQEDRCSEAAWDRELCTKPPDGDEFLRMFVIERLAPRLWNARLVYIINYV